jgi:hypothetical protein
LTALLEEEVVRGDGDVKDLPELSVLVVTFTMTAPMVAWMVYRGMPRRPVAETAAVMPVLGAALLVVGWLSVLPRAISPFGSTG